MIQIPILFISRRMSSKQVSGTNWLKNWGCREFFVCPKRENTFSLNKEFQQVYFFALRPCRPILSFLRERMESARRGELLIPVGRGT
jgi:hypothetical protein